MAPHRMRPAVFLDRDGTLIEDRGDLRRPCDVAFFADTPEALRRLQDRFLLFVVTQQSGISRGTLTFTEVEEVNKHLVASLGRHGVRIERCYVCPHQLSDGCRCIKPKPHFLLEAAKRFGIALERSYVVGDHPSDVELARNAGAQGIYVLTNSPILPGSSRAYARRPISCSASRRLEARHGAGLQMKRI
jgi:D-glycero-D-manno-heptose 1,7-bisphosphate phosphatase